MFNARPMSRLLIAASRDQLEPVIQELYRCRLFHIEDFVEQEEEGYEGFRIGKPLETASATSRELLRIRSVANTFGIRADELADEGKQAEKSLRSRIEGELPAIENEVEELVNTRTRLENRIKDYAQKVRDLEPFSAVPLDLDLYRGYEHVFVFTGHIPSDIEIPEPHEKYFTDAVPGNFLVVIVPLEQKDEVEGILLNAQFQTVSVPEEEGSAEDRIRWYKNEISRLETEFKQIDATISELKERHGKFLVACDELLTADVQQAEAPLRFATTDGAFVAEGWVPDEEVHRVKEALLAVTGGKIFVTDIEIDYERDHVPVEYENPSFARPTEVLLDIYSRPQYRELDPTIMMSIVYPLFFGFILGDVGYGLVLLVMSFGLRRLLKGDVATKLMDTLRNASVSSIVFGLLFSELFGFALPWEPLIPSRHLNIGAHATGHGPAVPELLIVSIWIGILHITLGRLNGMIDAKKMYHGSHATKAMIANAGWLLTMWGMIIMVWSFFPIPLMPDLTAMPALAMGMNVATVAGAVVAVAGVAGIAQENALEAVELPTIVSHVMSYARLAAVGLSSVAIAMVINYIAIGMIIEPQLESLSIAGILIILIGIVVWLIGQALNTALGLLGGGLHSLRLHYVEFFTKFYKGGGIKYKPFGMIRKFTED